MNLRKDHYRNYTVSNDVSCTKSAALVWARRRVRASGALPPGTQWPATGPLRRDNDETKRSCGRPGDVGLRVGKRGLELDQYNQRCGVPVLLGLSSSRESMSLDGYLFICPAMVQRGRPYVGPPFGRAELPPGESAPHCDPLWGVFFPSNCFCVNCFTNRLLVRTLPGRCSQTHFPDLGSCPENGKTNYSKRWITRLVCR